MEGETHGTETQGAAEGNAPQASGQPAPQSTGLGTAQQTVSGSGTTIETAGSGSGLTNSVQHTSVSGRAVTTQTSTQQSANGRAVEGAPSGVPNDTVSGSGQGDSGQGETDWQAQLDAKDAEMADMKVGYELRLAGVRNVKAAKALLGEYEGDITKLKAAEPWLFVAEQMVGANGAATSPNKPQGKTGLPNQGAALDEGKELKRWRQIAGLED